MMSCPEKSSDDTQESPDDEIKTYFELLTYSESIGEVDLSFLLKHLEQKRLIENPGFFGGRRRSPIITMNGFEKLENNE